MFVSPHSPHITRRIMTPDKEVFLTFDDGPTADLTPLVLDLLAKAGAQASFFVIGEKAKAHPELIERMKREGHAVLSHSKDHNYFNYFKTKSKLRTWMLESIEELQKQVKDASRAFRPPIGIITPPLLELSAEMKIPLILWNQRFYDGIFSWSKRRAIKNSQRLEAGDIILLHDRQSPQKHAAFLLILETYLQLIKQRGFKLSALPKIQIF